MFSYTSSINILLGFGIFSRLSFLKVDSLRLFIFILFVKLFYNISSVYSPKYINLFKDTSKGVSLLYLLSDILPLDDYLNRFLISLCLYI
jgi:hypothetical protein